MNKIYSLLGFFMLYFCVVAINDIAHSISFGCAFLLHITFHKVKSSEPIALRMKKRYKNGMDRLRLTKNPAICETSKQVTNPEMFNGQSGKNYLISHV